MENAIKRVEMSQSTDASNGQHFEIHAQTLAQMEKLAAIGQLSSSVAHEMRNLLGVIRNAAFNIDRALPDCDPSLQRNLDMINRSVGRARQFIDNLLNLSRMPAGAEEVIDIGAAVGELLVLFYKEMEWRNIELVRHYETLCIFHIDRNRLQECILNLVINAIQSMDHDGILTVRVEPWRKGVRIQIEDTGCGIAPEMLSDIFNRFFTTKANGEGTGLGLTISKTLAHEMGGEIHVESTIGEGSVFTILLPLLSAASHAGPEPIKAPSLVKVK
ncbi:MAG: HAMP domain-containing sensor histidine kinase [Candidatus Hinthialibacter antarcticus]|nr:HAMP domain-containing sensor histidine kinase [Candidatus Hinthialibacter antarcticus]